MRAALLGLLLAAAPVIEFYAAVARKDTSGFQGPDWHAEGAVSRPEALEMLTLWPAYAAFEERRRGSIEVASGPI